MPALGQIALYLGSTLAAVAQDEAGSGRGNALVLVAVILGLLVSGAALGVAWRARQTALHAAEEAGQARARAQAGAGGVSADALAATERVWTARLAAIEAQMGSSSSRGVTRPAMVAAPPADLVARLEQAERTLNGLAVTVKELRRPAPAAREAAPAPDAVAWPRILSSDTAAIADVRQALSQALVAGDDTVGELLTRLRDADRWPAAKPGSAELATSLQEISGLLLAVLRRGAAREPLDAALFADRVLAVLRPNWKSFQPQLDCRSVLPGTTLDPDWMEDRTATGTRRPVISEMLSWAVFEKLDAGRRVLAKARVTTD